MSLEEQLRELLDKLDLTCSMKSSGSRSKRAKLLKKEIALVRNKLSQQQSQPPPAESGTAGLGEEGAPPGPEPGEEGKQRCLPPVFLGPGPGPPRPARGSGSLQPCAPRGPGQGRMRVSFPAGPEKPPRKHGLGPHSSPCARRGGGVPQAWRHRSVLSARREHR